MSPELVLAAQRVRRVQLGMVGIVLVLVSSALALWAGWTFHLVAVYPASVGVLVLGLPLPVWLFLHPLPRDSRGLRLLTAGLAILGLLSLLGVLLSDALELHGPGLVPGLVFAVSGLLFPVAVLDRCGRVLEARGRPVARRLVAWSMGIIPVGLLLACCGPMSLEGRPLALLPALFLLPVMALISGVVAIFWSALGQERLALLRGEAPVVAPMGPPTSDSPWAPPDDEG